MEIIRFIIIIILSILINGMSLYYLIDKHKNDSPLKEDDTLIKGLNSYAISIFMYVLIVAFSFLINILALDLFNETLMVILVIVSYIIPMVVSFIHSNFTLEAVLYLTRAKEKSKTITIIILQNIVILCLSFMSLFAFVRLFDYAITNVLRITMLISFILSLTIMLIFKEVKPLLKEKKKTK